MDRASRRSSSSSPITSPASPTTACRRSSSSTRSSRWPSVPAGSEHEHVREDLPCGQALRDEAQREIPALAVAVVAPAPDPVVLQGLVHSEAVEQYEERDEDRI